MFHEPMMWGMHWFWWIFWLIVILSVAWAFSRSRGDYADASRPRRETPLEMLQRRYAEGEISTEEYEERKARLKRDQA